MATYPHAWAALAIVMAFALAGALWRQARPAAPAGAVRLSRAGEAAIAQPLHPAAPAAQRPYPAVADPLLAPDLRHTLELLLLEAGEAGDAALLKQRLAGLVGAHFPAELRLRALALAERYVDYRVALGDLAPHDAGTPQALRAALQARQATRLQFFDSAEYEALFAQEDALDRHTLARMEAALDPDLNAGQRDLALQAADALLPRDKADEYHATTAHLAAAAQTADFHARATDPGTRHAARSARYGEAAAQALALLDREEQHWQQRLEQYSQALAQPASDSAALRLQLFSAAELPRIDAALAWLQHAATAPAGPSGKQD